MTDQRMRLSAHERIILEYLDHRGPTHRRYVVANLVGSNSRTARTGGRGSNGAVPMIMENWCRRLTAAGMVEQVSYGSGAYRWHRITTAGHDKLRETTND